MRLSRSWLPRLFLSLCLLTLAACPAWALTVAGKVVGPTGRPVAGAYISDGVSITVSASDGVFSLASQPDRLVALTAPTGYADGPRWWWPAQEAAQRSEFRLSQARLHPAGRLPLTVLSDPHLYGASAAPSWAGKLDPTIPMRAWQNTVAQVKALAPALTLVLGDLAMNADSCPPSHARLQMALASRAAAMLPAPWRACPGNHDVRYPDGRVDYSLWRQYLGPVRSLSFVGPVAVVLLDNPGLSTRPNGKPRSRGILPDQALTWLKAVLALLPPTTPLLVGSHYPLASPLAGVNPLYPHGAWWPGKSRTAWPARICATWTRTRCSSHAASGRAARLAALISGHLARLVQQLVLITAAAPPCSSPIGRAPRCAAAGGRGDMRLRPGELSSPAYLECRA